MPRKAIKTTTGACRRPTAALRAIGAGMVSLALVAQGCFDPTYPQLDREARVLDALEQRDSRPLPPSPLTPADAVVYALANNLDAKVAEIENAYHNESAVAARRRLLPQLNLRYGMDHNNHPSARWSESTKSGNQSLESSYSVDPNGRHGEVSVMWNLIDFGVGYLKTRQQGERIRHSAEQLRRVRQQVVLDVLAHYWRAAAVEAIARDAEALRRELDEQAASIRDSVEMRILSGAEGARRELAVHGGLAELEQWRRAATLAKLELGRVMGCGNSRAFELARFPAEPPAPPPLPGDDPSSLQAAALQRRPELFQQDAQERIAVDEARIALLQMAPNANLSLGFHDDPDKFLEWNNWMTVGARVSWNLFNIPARLAERRVAKLQGDIARQKGLALAAAIMAQVGIAYSEWRLTQEYATVLSGRTDARKRLVDALAAGEQDGQTRPGEVLQERVRLLADKAAALRAAAEARVAGARLANAVGLDVDGEGRLLWNLGHDAGVDLLAAPGGEHARHSIDEREREAAAEFPVELSGLRVVKAEDFEAPAHFFARPAEADESVAEAVSLFADPFAVEPNRDTETGVFREEPLDLASGSLYLMEDMPEALSDPGFYLGDGLAATEAEWLRLHRDTAPAAGEEVAEVFVALPEDLQPAGVASAPKGPEELQALVPSDRGAFSQVRNLPFNSFMRNDPSPVPAEKKPHVPLVPPELLDQTEKMRALEPLTLLEPPPPADPVHVPEPKGALPGLRPPETKSALESLRPR